jgi:hypothetical protein
MLGFGLCLFVKPPLYQDRMSMQDTVASQAERVRCLHYFLVLEFQSYMLLCGAPYIFSSCQADISKTYSVYQLRAWYNVMELGLASCMCVRLSKHIWCLNIRLIIRGYVDIT